MSDVNDVSGRSRLHCYLDAGTIDDRLRLLREIAASDQGLPTPVVVALLRLELPVAEKVALLEAVSRTGPDVFEDFVFDHMIHWPQEVAARALRLWAGMPTCSRWDELVRLAPLPGLPQRVLYTMLDVSTRAPDGRLLKAVVDVAMGQGQASWSPAFNALLFVRMVQRGIKDPRVLDLARSTCERAAREFVPDDKSALAAWVYLWRFDPSGFEKLQSAIPGDSPQSMLRLLPGDRSLAWMPFEDTPAVHSRRAPSRTRKSVDFRVEDDGAGACLSWLLSRDVAASAVKDKVSGVWSEIVTVGDTSEGDDRWTAATNSLRPRKGIYRIACIRALGKRRGSDLAVLKLLDFVRSGDTRELIEVARALAAIASPRSVQELISMISRPNATVDLQLELTQILKSADLATIVAHGGHAGALSAASSHLAGLVRLARENGAPGGTIEALVEVWESLAQLSGNQPDMPAMFGSRNDADEKMMDDALAKSIPHYAGLSAEVKRALRTAWYFHRQTDAGSAASSIDLSPVIDMQYKAMELLFREYFEDFCGRLIHQGTIQRKLDLIGYSRPVPEKMDEFENFVAALPGIKSIPFFSKFKLRKMLLALCQFKPGKRFTLDGLKAFGLFFLVFGREECRFGLSGIIPVVPRAFKDQAALAAFCSLLHVFQDSRNRAAHEGFHPDAAADINGIWRNTAEIVQLAYGLRQVLSGISGEPGLVRGRAS